VIPMTKGYLITIASVARDSAKTFVAETDASTNKVFLNSDLRIFGTNNEDSTHALIGQVLAVVTNAAGKHDLENLKYALATINGIGPKDELEGLLAVQMIGVHSLAIECLKRASREDQTTYGMDANINRATKLLRTFTAQMEALNRHRGEVGQQMVAGNVNVNEGGQAIVGAVSNDGRGTFLTSSAWSSQLWSKTQSDGSSPGCSCRTAASASLRIRAPSAPSSGSASTSPPWSKPPSCASRELILVCLTNLFTRYPPMPPKLNRKRALFVLTKIDEILAWEKQKEAERDTRFVELGRYLCEVRAGQYWRLENLKSFDEFLARRFPESRRKAYYLMSIHEHLPPQARKDLKEVGWTKGLELAKLARRDRQHFDCATWLHKARELPKEDFRRAVEKELTGKEEEPSELIYFKVYKSQAPVIEQAIETAALMLGTDKSRGYCLEMICADFLAGAHLDNGNPEILLNSISLYYKFLPGEQKQRFLTHANQKAS